MKTSTGKINLAATLPVALCMLEAVRDVHEETGRRVGFKAAGGVRQAKQAVQHLALVHETLGPDWLTPDLYRIGASSSLTTSSCNSARRRPACTSLPTTSRSTDRRTKILTFVTNLAHLRDTFAPIFCPTQKGGGWVVGRTVTVARRPALPGSAPAVATQRSLDV